VTFFEDSPIGRFLPESEDRPEKHIGLDSRGCGAQQSTPLVDADYADFTQ
jgi:hypothetical protein